MICGIVSTTQQYFAYVSHDPKTSSRSFTVPSLLSAYKTSFLTTFKVSYQDSCRSNPQMLAAQR